MTEMTHEVTGQKIAKVIVIWDNGDGTMTTFTGKGKGLNLTIKNAEPRIDYSNPNMLIFGPDVIEKVTIDTELITDPETGNWAVWKVGEIPEF